MAVTYDVAVRPLAEGDIIAAMEYYEAVDDRLPGRLRREFDATIEPLKQFPRLGRRKYRGSAA